MVVLELPLVGECVPGAEGEMGAQRAFLGSSCYLALARKGCCAS